MLFYRYYNNKLIIGRSSCKFDFNIIFLVIMNNKMIIIYIFRGKFHNKLDNIQKEKNS